MKKEITSPKDAGLEFANPVLNPHSLASSHAAEASWGPWGGLCKGTGGKKKIS